MTSLTPAKLTDRFLAYLIDFVPFVAGYFATLRLLILRLHWLHNTTLVWTMVAGAWVWLYLAYQVVGNLSGATLGKRLFGIKVVALDGAPLGLKRSLARAFGYLLSTPLLNLGFLWSLGQPQSRAWHDLLAGSLVVEVREKPPLASALSAAVSLVLVLGLSGVYLWSLFWRPTPRDRDAVRKAREGLRILAAIEETHKRWTGTYTELLGDLAKDSGDVATFKQAMSELFDEDSFQLSAGKDRFWIRGRAKDRKKTSVTIEGP